MKSLNLVESIVNDFGKFIDKKDLLKETLNNNDELLSSTSLGRVFKVLVEKAVEIDDLNEAYFIFMKKAFLQTLLEASEQLGMINNIKDLSLEKDKEYNVDAFDIDNLLKNPIYIDFIEIIKNNLTNNEDTQRLTNRIKKIFKANVFQFIDKTDIVLKPFQEYINSDEQKEKLKQHKKEKYYSDLKSDFISTIFDDDKGMTLKDTYIEPDFKIHKKCFNKDDKRCKVENHSEDKIFFCHEQKINLHQFVNQAINNSNTLDLKESKQDIFYIFGYPGQGKSSFCKRFIYDYVTEKEVYDKPVYLIKLRDISNPRDLINNPYETLKEIIQNDIGDKELDFNNCILILDGLDELYMKQDINSNEVESFCLNIAREKKEQKIIITSRYGYVDYEKIYKNKTLLIQIDLFDIEKQKNWLNKYNLFHELIHLNNKKLEEMYLEENRSNYNHILELINQPILLHMIVSLNIEMNNELNRTELYEKMFDLLIDRKYDNEGQIENLQGLKKETLRELLQEIALHIYHSDFEYIRKHELEKIVEPLNKELSDKLNSDIAFKKTIKGLMIAFYFQETKKSDFDSEEDDKSEKYAIEFLHKSLMEYLVAEKIWFDLEEFVEIKKRGKFVVDDYEYALKILWRLSANKIISEEIKEHLEVLGKNFESKELLHTRLSFFLEELLNNQFVPYIKTNKIVDKALNTFYFYWSIISILDIEENIINNKDTFINLYSKLESGKTNLDLQYQNFDATLFNQVTLGGSYRKSNSFKKTSFIGAWFVRCHFIWINFDNTNFSEITFIDSNFVECSFKNVNFTKANFHSITNSNPINFFNSNLKEASFHNMDVSGYNFKNVLSAETIIFDKCKNVNEAKFPEGIKPNIIDEDNDM